MSLVSVDAARCTRDAICVASCPAGILELRPGATAPTAVAGADGLCIECGHCVAVCPHAALSHRSMASADCLPIRQELAVGLEQAEQLLRSRRSIRAYQARAVEREKLERLVALACHAPTASNRQPIHWTVLGARDQVKRAAGHVVDRMRDQIARREPLASAYRLERLVMAWDAGSDGITRGAPALVVASAPRASGMGATDCAIALTHLDVAAPTLGLGACWAGFFMYAATDWAPLLQDLALPEGHACFGALMIGYPKHRYHRLPLRHAPSISWR